MEVISKDTPIWQLTVGQFKELLKSTTNVVIKKEEEKKKIYYGLDGLAEVLGCGRTKASQIKNSGVIDDAITQYGGNFAIDGELALKLLKENHDRKYRFRRKR